MTAKADAERLMNSAMPLAIKMLKEHGEFYPYGAILTSEGKIVDYGAKGDGNRPKSAELICILEQAFRNEVAKDSVKATALIFDVLIEQPDGASKKDAIQVDIEHCSGYAVSVYHPYAIEDGELHFEPPFTLQKDFKIFNL